VCCLHSGGAVLHIMSPIAGQTTVTIGFVSHIRTIMYRGTNLYFRKFWHFWTKLSQVQICSLVQDCWRMVDKMSCILSCNGGQDKTAPAKCTQHTTIQHNTAYDNITSQPWSHATCPCTTSSSADYHFVTLFLFEKTRQSTRSSGAGARRERLTHCHDNVIMSRPGRSGGVEAGFEAIRGWEP